MTINPGTVLQHRRCAPTAPHAGAIFDVGVEEVGMKKDPLREYFASEIYSHECESPIERMLLRALFYKIGLYMYECADQFGTSARCPLTVETQWVERDGTREYRIDIVLLGSSGGARLGIECDGHEFHEKTKEQAQRDKSRDRVLSAAGWKMIRFTGSEIWKNPLACADEAFGIAMDMEGSAAEVAFMAARSKGGQ
ncbi:MAG TPA: hypothetical protein DDW98_13485 [Gammaproteobacteria bacterium]|jgi:hypothetical protein|nr:hypothetical protein [Gammaproteobacteria bacterium]